MKKALARIMLLALTIVIIAGVMPLSANASSSSNKTTIFSYLTKELGFNSAAACGIMANIEKESSFRSNVIIRDSNGLPSGGLCMWNGKRLTSLKNYCAKKGFDYLSIEGQLSYLEHELQNSYYKHIYNYLKNVSNTSQGAYNAAHYWCYYFEIPANRGSKSVQRGNAAIKNYWPVYGGVELKAPKLAVASGTKYEPNKKLTVKWSSAGSDADGYRVYLAKKNTKTGKYDYDSAKVAKLSSKDRSHTFKATNMQIGSYKVYVYAYNNNTGIEEKSNVLSFSIKCPEHNYTSKITTVPTEKKAGVKTFTCKTCGKVKTESLSLKDYIDISKVQNVRVTATTETKIKVKWNEFKYADGYRVYVKDGDKWVSLGTAKQSDDHAFVAKNLKSNTSYTFKVKAYRDFDDGRIYTVSSKTVTATTKKAAVKPEATTKPEETTKVEEAQTNNTNTEETNSKIDLTALINEFYAELLKRQNAN